MHKLNYCIMNLKDFRHKKGITQKEMALRMAMEQTTYSRKENGKSPITEDEWKRFAKVLDTSIEELKKGNESVPKNENCTFNDNAIGFQIISMPKEAWEIMIKYSNKLEEENAQLKEQLKNPNV